MKGWKTEKACHYVVVIFEAGNIKRWKEYTEELYKKDPNDLDNHEGVITHLKPDILEYEVKSALGNITMNKAKNILMTWITTMVWSLT